MALTPEDVVNKRFQPTKFREGYDQDEVDDFLDEVVAELRRLTAVNEDLQTRLDACEQRAGGAGDVAGAVPAGSVEEPAPEPAGAETPAVAEPEPEPVAASTAERPADGAPEEYPPGEAPARERPGAAQPHAAAEMLVLAQKVHDDYVRQGEQERDRVVTEAQEHAARLVHDAEEKQRQTLGALEQERSLLERKIDELRSFERDYRARLKSYLESQLRDLDSKGSVLPSHGAAADATG